MVLITHGQIGDKSVTVKCVIAEQVLLVAYLHCDMSAAASLSFSDKNDGRSLFFTPVKPCDNSVSIPRRAFQMTSEACCCVSMVQEATDYKSVSHRFTVNISHRCF